MTSKAEGGSKINVSLSEEDVERADEGYGCHKFYGNKVILSLDWYQNNILHFI